MEIKYSCQNNPSRYVHINEHKDFPAPEKDTYYWHISNFSPDMDKFRIILAIEKVMTNFQRAFDGITPIGQYIHFKSTAVLGEADFIFTFGSDSHEFPTADGAINTCPFPFDGKGKVLAHAWSLITGQGFGGQMHFDEAEKWGDMHDAEHTHLITVAMHEFGHCLDLGHSKVKGALMYPTYNGEKAKLHSDDLKGLQAKFGDLKQKIYEEYYMPFEEEPEVPTKPSKVNPKKQCNKTRKFNLWAWLRSLGR